jgi:hypothetical protein
MVPIIRLAKGRMGKNIDMNALSIHNNEDQLAGSWYDNPTSKAIVIIPLAIFIVFTSIGLWLLVENGTFFIPLLIILLIFTGFILHHGIKSETTRPRKVAASTEGLMLEDEKGGTRLVTWGEIREIHLSRGDIVYIKRGYLLTYTSPQWILIPYEVCQEASVIRNANIIHRKTYEM